MQFYLQLWMDTGLTLSALGKWEEDNLAEYEAYMTAYVTKLEEQYKEHRKQRLDAVAKRGRRRIR